MNPKNKKIKKGTKINKINFFPDIRAMATASVMLDKEVTTRILENVAFVDKRQVKMTYCFKDVKDLNLEIKRAQKNGFRIFFE